jgi:hypothetical protein
MQFRKAGSVLPAPHKGYGFPHVSVERADRGKRREGEWKTKAEARRVHVAFASEVKVREFHATYSKAIIMLSLDTRASARQHSPL